jgi:Xaa-Pro aminopeptidase
MDLALQLARILDSEPYPTFSNQEMSRRHGLIWEAMAEAGVDHLLLYGSQRAGSAIPWLTGWPVTREAVAILTPGEQDVLLIQFFNHVPTAREIAADAQVAWGGASTMEKAVEVLRRRGSAAGRVGVIGALPYPHYGLLAGSTVEAVDLNRIYTNLRLIKSAEEIDWLRIGAWMSDLAVTALGEQARPGMTEHDLTRVVEDAYLSLGGTTHIHYLGVTSMEAPNRCVPSQFPSRRQLRTGDVLFAEISASFWGYPGQVLRTYTVETEPTPLYGRLHEVAEAAFLAIGAVLRDGASARQVVEAAGIIEEAGFSTYDDLLHGFGGGYLPPVLGSKSRPNTPIPDFAFRTGMTVVIQPNVITRDELAGVQTGELVRVTDDGIESLHHVPRQIRRVGQA